ncbi:MAG TPA: metallophosphoesterase [Microbacteriaceae bacterium]|nr:metallophosphoesterase [Microbacteriaceae bacterium]
MTTNERGLRILHLSDTHLFGDHTLHHGVVDTRAALRRVLDRAAALDAVDVVVASGDLSDDGSPESYRRLRTELDPWAKARGASVVYVMGNHDLRDGFEAEIGARTGVIAVDGYRIVQLDSSVPGFGYGDVDAGQLEWLRSTLADPAEHGTVVVLHHPPVPASTPLLATLELQHPAAILEVCAAADVRLILSGHYHHGLAAEAAGIPVVVAPGVTNTSDVIAPAGYERATVGAGFALIDLPLTGSPRATFIAATGPDDGTELYLLGADDITRIAEESGPPR